MIIKRTREKNQLELETLANLVYNQILKGPVVYR
jgi:hypothetical protein